MSRRRGSGRGGGQTRSAAGSVLASRECSLRAARMPFMQARRPPAVIPAPSARAPAASRPRPALVREQDAAARTRGAEAGQGEKFQSITYYKCVDDRSVRGVPIDYLGAMREMDALPVTEGSNRFIGFENTRSGENVQFLRLGDDLWYADVPINDGPNWDGYYWGARADSKAVAALLRLFFEEMPWFGMLPFTMRRYRG